MTTLILVSAMVLAQQPESAAGLDRSLVQEIAVWKKGDPPPRRLLKYPDGPPLLPPLCGMRAFGCAVEDYVSHIRDVEFLKTLVFDPQADNACFHAASSQLLQRRGVNDLRAIRAERHKSDPGDFNRSELATLTQLLTSPYARILVASLDKKDASKDLAEKALESLTTDLAAGITWHMAYRKAADLLPDRERAQKEGGWRTLLCYCYDGLVSPTGFDLLTRTMSDRLDPGHVRKLFEAKGRVHRLETETAYWVYFVEAVYE